MRRRLFVTGSFLALTAAWAARARPAGSRRPAGAEPLPDGRTLVRDAALAFGTTVSIAAVGEDPAALAQAAAEALDRTRAVDSLMTVFRRESQVGRLNAEGVLYRPDPRLVRVLQFSQRLSALSQGAFDVTVQPLWRLFVSCREAGRRPSPGEVAEARALVDWTALEVGPRRVALGRPGMQITLNGVAQGYAADLAMEALRERGVRDALLDTGELGAEGERQPRRPWTVGIQHPRLHDAVVATVAMDGRFLATSGDYATPFSDDLCDHHIFDPRTGRSPPGLSSAAVAAPTGMEADGLTKPMMVLDLPRARALLSRFPGAGAIWMDKRGQVVASERMPPSAG
ncbi:MAG TPA: FAD:protein FMN transferase [Anaeromyxobacteraceae bacterium]|nr:FAD:protein FMN transferase [Anaeromyxobacteraceae bacterium]